MITCRDRTTAPQATRSAAANERKTVDWHRSRYAGSPERGTIHLWRLPLTAMPEWRLAELRGWLSGDERARLDRLLFADVGRRFLIARAGMRGIIARYLGVAPESLIFTYGPQGKPGLGTPPSALEFNLSHSGDLAMLAVTIDQPVGVDLEQIRPKENLLAIARRMLPAEQYRELQALQGDCLVQAFFRFWTAIEAQAKAAGKSVFQSPREQAFAAWDLRHLVPAPGYLAAVAARRLPTDAGSWQHLDPGWDDPA